VSVATRGDAPSLGIPRYARNSDLSRTRGEMTPCAWKVSARLTIILSKNRQLCYMAK